MAGMEGMDSSYSLPMALSTRSGVKGHSLTQAPTASWIAMATAGAAPLTAISETLLPPKGPTSSATGTSSTWKSSGTSRMDGIL